MRRAKSVEYSPAVERQNNLTGKVEFYKQSFGNGKRKHNKTERKKRETVELEHSAAEERQNNLERTKRQSGKTEQSKTEIITLPKKYKK